MNNTIDAIYSRRSIRSYESTKVSEDILKEIMIAGTYAPSARNMQSSVIYLVKDDVVHNKLVDLGVLLRGSDPFYGAPHIVLVMSKKDTFCPIQDGSLVLGNMMLCARDFGVGSCWINCLNDILNLKEAKELKDLIDPNNEYVGVGALILGYPKDGIWPKEKEKKKDYIKYL